MVSSVFSVPLLELPAMALAASNRENVSSPAVSFVFLIRVHFPFVFAPRKRIKTIIPAEESVIWRLSFDKEEDVQVAFPAIKELHECIGKSIQRTCIVPVAWRILPSKY